MLVTRFWRNNSNMWFFFFFFFEKTVRGEPSLQPLLLLGFLSCLFFFTLSAGKKKGHTSKLSVWSDTAYRVLPGGSCCPRVLGPGNMSPWRCASRKGCGHTFGKCFVLHSLLGSSSALWGVKSTKKSFKEDTFVCFFLNLGFPQIIWLLDSTPPTPIKTASLLHHFLLVVGPLPFVEW